MQYQALWEKLFSNFESIGIGTYEVYFGRNPQLFREIGANRIPQFIAVVNGRAIKYKGDMNQRGVRDFISTILPHHMITHVSSSNYILVSFNFEMINREYFKIEVIYVLLMIFVKI